MYKDVTPTINKK